MAETTQKIVCLNEFKLVVSGVKSKMDAAIAAVPKYSLPIAGTALGGVKNGGNVTVSGTGTMSVAASTATVAGVITENRVTELAGAKAQALIDAIPAYSLPTASATVLGGVKVGTGLAIDGNGVLSATGDAAVDPSALPTASTTAKGAVIVGTGLAIGADDKLNLNTASASVLGGVKVGTNIAVNAGTISVATATATVKGVASFGSGLVVTNGAVTLDEAKVNTLAEAKAKAEVAKVVNGAPETFDTLKEIADYIEDHKSVETALNTAIGKKANATDLTTLAGRVTTLEGSAGNLEYMTEADATAMVTEIFG